MHDTVAVLDAPSVILSSTALAALDPTPTTCTDLVPYGLPEWQPTITPVMKATVASLKAAIARVKPHVPRSGGLPILQYVRLTSGPGNTIVVTASDPDTATRFTIDGIGLPGFDALVLLENLKGFVDGFDRKEAGVLLRLEQHGDSVRLLADVTDAELHGKDVAEFPRMGAFAEYDEANQPLGWPVDIDALAEVAAAASTDDNRPIITGVLMENDVVVGTDSYQLFFVEGVPGWPGAPIIIPARAVQLAFKQRAGGVYLTDDGRTLIFICPDGGLIATRLIEGQFPNWRGLVPTSYPNILRVDDHGAIARAVKRLKYLLKDSLPIRLGYKDGELAFQATRSDHGKQHAKIGAGVSPVQGHMGLDESEDWHTIGAFNHGYLTACFAGLDSDAVTFEGIDMLKPWVIRAPKANGTTACRLLMPVRVS